MPATPSITPARRRVRRRRRRVPPAPPPAPPLALTLVSANYYEGTAEVILVFDRAVDVSGFAAGQVMLDDGQVTFTTYLANGAPFQDGPTTLRLPLDNSGSSSISDVRLTASALTGIVAADDGGTWAGASSINLPWP